VRARAYEVLDTAGEPALNRAVMKVLEWKQGSNSGREDGKNAVRGHDRLCEAVSVYGNDGSGWIRKCAGFARETIGLKVSHENAAVQPS
jgi:hypothetical protein